MLTVYSNATAFRSFVRFRVFVTQTPPPTP
jgi:hypothetical protein